MKTLRSLTSSRPFRAFAGRPSSALALGFALVLASCGGSAGTSRLAPTGPGVSAPAMTPATTAVRECASAGGAPASYPGWPSGPSAPSASSPSIVPIVVSQELAVGPNRFLITIVDASNNLLASPDTALQLRFFNLAANAAKPAFETEGKFIWLREPDNGVYHASVDFSCAGDWGVEVTARKGGAQDATQRVVFPVADRTSTPPIRGPVPASETPVATTPDELRAITTDTNPDPDFYRISVKDALAAGKPFLVIFSTPAFCRTRTCGPALDIVKAAAAPFKGRVNFIHVEPYVLTLKGGQLQPVLDARGELQATPITDQWGLVTEPYIFLMGRDGRVFAKFEGVAGRDELDAALAEVTR